MATILGGCYHLPEATRNAIKRAAKTTQYHHKRAWRYQFKIQQVVDNLIASAYKIGRSSFFSARANGADPRPQAPWGCIDPEARHEIGKQLIWKKIG
jgi:hypothetical protein